MARNGTTVYGELHRERQHAYIWNNYLLRGPLDSHHDTWYDNRMMIGMIDDRIGWKENLVWNWNILKLMSTIKSWPHIFSLFKVLTQASIIIQAITHLDKLSAITVIQEIHPCHHFASLTALKTLSLSIWNPKAKTLIQDTFSLRPQATVGV